MDTNDSPTQSKMKESSEGQVTTDTSEGIGGENDVKVEETQNTSEKSMSNSNTKEMEKDKEAEISTETAKGEPRETVQTQTSFEEKVDVPAFEATTSLLFDYIKDVEEKFLPNVKDLLGELQEKEESLEKDAETMTTDVGEQCSKITSKIEMAKEEMTEEIKDDKEKRQAFIEERKKELTRVRENAEALLDICKEHLMKGGKLMMEFFHEKCPTVTEMEREIRPTNVTSTFEIGIIDVPELRKEIGKLTLHSKKTRQPQRVTLYTFPHPALSEVDAHLVNTFSTEKIVGDVRGAENPDEVWVTDENSHYITKYNSKGEVLQQINTSCFNECFILDGESNFLVCNLWESKIMKVDPEGNVSELIKDLPALPTGICLNFDQDIVVCMQDYPWIPIYSPDGKVKKKQMTIRDPMDDAPPQGTDDDCIQNCCEQEVCPYRVTQSSFGDYLIVDAVWPFKIICLDINGKFRWKYIVDQVENVYAYNICSTLGNDVIIADVETQRFHVINPDGHAIRFISYQELGLVDAWSMSIDDKGQLWTGQDDGKVHIINLNLN